MERDRETTSTGDPRGTEPPAEDGDETPDPYGNPESNEETLRHKQLERDERSNHD